MNRLAELSGIPAAELVSLANQVRANHATLDACHGHAFASIAPGTIATKYRCANCGGTVDAIAYRWYERGRADAKVA